MDINFYGKKILAMAIVLAAAVAAGAMLMADREFNDARAHASGSRWKEAEREFGHSIKFDPFDAGHHAAYGEFLLMVAGYMDFKEPYLKKAEELYSRAAKLNPRNADYRMKLGLIRLQLGAQTKDDVAKAMAYIKDAIKFDPKGFNAAYESGYAAIPIWKKLNADEQELVVGRLKYALGVKPWFGPKYIYPRLWKYTGDFKLLQEITPENEEANRALYSFLMNNNLWQFCAAERKELSRYAKKEKRAPDTSGLEPKDVVAPDGWRGLSANGKGVYKKGNMYWSGTMDTLINVPSGPAAIKIQARGSSAGGIYPYMIVELDGKEIGDAYVDSAEWKEYGFRVRTDGGMKALSVTFANDGGNKEKKEDRNLYVGESGVSRE